MPANITLVLHPDHPARAEMASLCALLRGLRRSIPSDLPADLQAILRGLQVVEIYSSWGTVTYVMRRGGARAGEAVLAYDFLRNGAPALFTLLVGHLAPEVHSLTLHVSPVDRRAIRASSGVTAHRRLSTLPLIVSFLRSGNPV